MEIIIMKYGLTIVFLSLENILVYFTNHKFFQQTLVQNLYIFER
jgi:hypothetical protein